MSQTPDPRNTPLPGSAEHDAWARSLMGRTEELAHVQAQTAPEPVAPAPPSVAPGVAVRAQPLPAQVNRRREPPPPPPPPSTPAAVLRLGAAVCGLAAAVLFSLPAIRSVGEPPPASPAEVPRPETTLAPSFDTPQKVREGEVGEQRAFMQGASVLMADSEPSGATVAVNGHVEGTTPLTVTQDCALGSSVVVTFTRKGYAPVEHTTMCRADTITRLSARLSKGRGGAKP